MRRSLVLSALAIAACGRSALDQAPPGRPPSDPACADATLAGAATPAVGFCSDGSHRAPTLAPRHPIVRWTVHDEHLGQFVVDDRGWMFGGSRMIDDRGASRRFGSDDPGRGTVSFIDRHGRVVAESLWDFTTRARDGSLVGSFTTEKTHFPPHVLAAAGADGAIDLMRPSRGPLSESVGSVVRYGSDLAPRWEVSTGCFPADGDHSNPASVIRLADGRIAATCSNWQGSLSTTFIGNDGRAAGVVLVPGRELASNLAQSPNGDVMLLGADGTEPSTTHRLWTLRPDGSTSSVPLETLGAARIAVARDGTVVVRSDAEIFVVDAGGSLRFRVPAPKADVYRPMGLPDPPWLFVDAESTIVSWGESIEARSLDDGTLLWSHAVPGSVFIYVTTAGPYQLYALTREGDVSSLSDP